MTDNKAGLFGKYKIAKSDGSPIDPDAIYFVLRIDGKRDPEQNALYTYIEEIWEDDPDHPQLAHDLWHLLQKCDASWAAVECPACQSSGQVEDWSVDDDDAWQDCPVCGELEGYRVPRLSTK